MPDFMLLVYGGQAAQATDALVMDAPDIREAITLIEAALHCSVDHGRTHHTSYTYDPAVVLDAATGEITWRHHERASTSLQFARPAGGQVLTPKGGA